LELSPSRYLSLGFEANWRTQLKHVSASDPLWITPSLHIKTSTGFNLFGGVDLSVASERSGNDPKALAPWRAFGGISASFDVFAKDRAAARRKAEKDSLELVRLRKESKELSQDKLRLGGDSLQLSKKLDEQRSQLQRLADSLAMRQKELNAKDSALAQRLKELALKDSSLLAAEQARHRQMSRADSLEAKRIQDSIAMAKSLEDERAKRGAFERDLISKGVAKLEAVYFENGKTELSINSKPYLQMIGGILAKYPKLKLEVGGHTDSKGAKAANLKLSTGRAKSVRAFFVENYPELSQSITFKGYGSTKPKASNATADGRLQNRRVEMKVLNPEVLKEYTTP
jgi:outer membrane protein OmpA-like peptidoglycan-associated protein